MKLSELLAYITYELHIETGDFPSKTKLLKLGYLVDLYYCRQHGKLISDAAWIYYKYGPYVSDYDDQISSYPFESESVISEAEKSACIVRIADDYESRLSDRDDFDVKRCVKHIVKEFGLQSLPDLLDFVYFETEPMQYAIQRGQRLDFSKVKPATDYKIRSHRVDKQKLRKIIQSKKGSLQSANRI